MSALLPEVGFIEAQRSIASWPGYCPSPLVRLSGLAADAGVSEIWLKDESERFQIGSFKALGGPYAAFRVVRDRIAGQRPGADITPEALLDGRHKDLVRTLTVTSATDGNHGRALAWGAERFGCRCVIYLHEGVSESREAAISQYGAEIVRTPGTYDDSARQSAADAETNGWALVSDTTPGDDYGLALDVMQGYRLMVDEALTQLGSGWPTHVFVQAGCGGTAAAVLAHLAARRKRRRRPRFIVVEPDRAACLYRSAEVGEPVTLTDDLDTIMAGLSVGEVSGPAWEILGPGADYFEAIPDGAAVDAVRRLASGDAGDPPVVAGESGVAGIAGLMAVAESQREPLALESTSRVLVFNTEGDTAPDVYKEIVGRTASEVRARSVLRVRSNLRSGDPD